MELSEANAACLISGEAVEDLEPLEKEKAPHLSPSPLQKNILLLQLPYLI